MGKSDENQKELAELRKKITINVKKTRKEKRYTQEQLAEKSNISYDFMRRIESTNGGCGFSILTLYKLAIALDVSVDELMDLPQREKVSE